MQKTTKTGIIGVIIGLCIAGLIAFLISKKTVNSQIDSGTGSNGGISQPGGDSKTSGGDSKTNGGDSKTNGGSTDTQVTKTPVKPSAVDRIIPRTIKAEFAMTGKGSDAKWGIGKQANFRYTVNVDAKSEIISKHVFPTGNIEVREKRTFTKVFDSVVVSEVDFVLALDSLPIQEFSIAIDAAATLFASWTLNPEPSLKVVSVKNGLLHELQKVDGQGLRALLNCCGVQLKEDVEQKLNELAGNEFTRAIGGIRTAISGKAYLITYLQDASGMPMTVDFKNEDGSEVTDEEELMVLKRVNAFIDYHLVPDKDCSPGARWTVYAEDMEELFDPFVDGRYSGTVNVERQPNEANGDWCLKMYPGTINVVGNGGSTIGSLRLEDGKAKVDPKNVSVNDIFVKGQAKMAKLTRHHWLFTAKVDGWCKFEGRAVTVPLEQ